MREGAALPVFSEINPEKTSLQLKLGYRLVLRNKK